MGKKKYTIEIEIICKDKLRDSEGFKYSLDEINRLLKEGYHKGVDCNNDEEYSFAIVKIENK